MRSSFEKTFEILMQAATVGGKDDNRGIAENIMFGQMEPMGTGAFKVALGIDMLKDVIIDHRFPVPVTWRRWRNVTGGGYSPSSPNAYTPTSPSFVPHRRPFGHPPACECVEHVHFMASRAA